MKTVTTVPVKSVTIDQAEGRVDRLVKGEYATIADACAALRSIQRQCEPDMLGYLKTDVVITWQDGSRQGFRADVNQHGDDTNLTEMLLGWAERNKAGATGRSMNIKRLLPPDQVAAWEAHAARLLNGELAIT
jgi:hypothetical protein